MKKAFFYLFYFLLCLNFPLFASNIKGILQFFNTGGVLLQTEDGEWAGLFTKNTLFEGVSGVQDLKPLTQVEITYEFEKGLPLIQIIKSLPFYYSLPENEINLKFPLNNILPVDCREEKDYKMYHLPGAIWFSPNYLNNPEKLFKEGDKTVVFYGENRQDSRPFFALSNFLKKGFKAKVYPDGVIGWNQNWGIFESQADLSNFPENTCFFDINFRGNSEQLKYLSEDLLIWNNFSKPYGMPFIVLIGNEKEMDKSYQIAEKIVKWRYKQEPVMDKPVIIWKGKQDSFSSLNLKKDCFVQEGALSGENFLNLLNNPQKDYLFIDLRFPPSKLKENFHSIPLEFLKDKIQELPRDKTLILFCSKGHRAKIAHFLLKKLNFNVKYLSEEVNF